MDFEKISELISKKITGQITGEEEALLDEWANTCSKNRQLYERLLNTSYLQAQYKKWSIIQGNSELSRQQMVSRIKHERQKRFAWIRSIAAVLIIGLISVLSYYLYNSDRKYRALLAKQEAEKYLSSIQHGHTQAMLTTDDGKTVVLGESMEYNKKAINSLKNNKRTEIIKQDTVSKDRIALNNLEIPRGGEFHIILEDSTEVWLNAESSLKYPEHFNEKRREVEITGEAYFKVAKDERRAFYVKSRGHRIKVYGTEFNIFSYDDDEFVYTTLVKGSISLQNLDNSNTELFLTPGHQAVFAKADSTVSIKTIKPDIVTSWREGMFVFEDKTLSQIMKSLSRWYDFSYKFSNEEVANTVFMGRIPRYGKFGDVLEILEKSGHLKIEVNKNQIIISNK